MVVGDVDGHDLIHEVNQSIPHGYDSELVPLAILPGGAGRNLAEDFLGTIFRESDLLMSSGNDASFAELLAIHHPEVFGFGVEIRLVAFQDDTCVIHSRTALLNPRVIPGKLDLTSEFEVGDLATLPDKKSVSLGRVRLGGLTHNGSLLYSPESVRSFPSFKGFSVKQRLERGTLGRWGSRGNSRQNDRKGEQENEETSGHGTGRMAKQIGFAK